MVTVFGSLRFNHRLRVSELVSMFPCKTLRHTAPHGLVGLDAAINAMQRISSSSSLLTKALFLVGILVVPLGFKMLLQGSSWLGSALILAGALHALLWLLVVRKVCGVSLEEDAFIIGREKKRVPLNKVVSIAQIWVIKYPPICVKYIDDDGALRSFAFVPSFSLNWTWNGSHPLFADLEKRIKEARLTSEVRIPS